MEPHTQRKDRDYLNALKAAGTPISVLTCYDYPTACAQDAAGLDIIFIGDSVATNVLGHNHQNDLTIDAFRVLVRAVNRGIQQAYFLVDLPFCACENIATIRSAASQFIADGASGIKFEGFHPEVVRQLTDDGFEVWTHLGYLPQYHSSPTLIGTEAAAAEELLQQAKELESAGAAGLILELVPAELAQSVSKQTKFPVIGIGAGPFTDGQVQVWHDLVGLSQKTYRHAVRLAEIGNQSQEAIKTYLQRVADRQIP